MSTRSFITTYWINKIHTMLTDMNDKCCAANCQVLTEEIFMPSPFHMVHFTAPFSLLVHGYLHEKYRMSNISIKCNHHQNRFSNNSKLFISFIMNTLHEPLKLGKGLRYRFNEIILSNFDVVLELISIGICQLCAFYLASELPTFLIKAKKCILRNTTGCDVMLGLFTIILQYPPLAIYCFKHKYLWKYMEDCFTLISHWNVCCTVNKNIYPTDVDATRSSLFCVGNQILRNSYLLKKSKYWSRNVAYLMRWLIKTFQFYIKENDPMDYTVNCMLNVNWMIILFWYHSSRKNKEKLSSSISRFREQLFQVLSSDMQQSVSDDVGKKYRIMLVKELCLNLIEIIDTQQCNNYFLQLIQQKAWEIKKRDTKCLWNKCDNTAKTNKLYKCKRCVVARYCSKKCQKKDWNVGNHKEICFKFNTL